MTEMVTIGREEGTVSLICAGAGLHRPTLCGSTASSVRVLRVASAEMEGATEMA